jgi:hypothetical protein
MSIFNLHSNVLADHRDFFRSFYAVADRRACASHRWGQSKHGLLRAEMGACFACACGLTRDGLCWILTPAEVHGPDFLCETFRAPKEKETAKFVEYRPRRLVLEVWDKVPPQMQDVV